MTSKPLIEIIAQTMTKTPPMTAAGMAEIKADNLLEKPKIINQMPALMKTLRLATPVIEMMPALVE